MSPFITFEGPEGSGKTTQIQLLHRALLDQKRNVICTREPGGTPIGEQIRNVLHDLQNKAMLPTTEALLYCAARAQLVGQLIRPAMEQGAVIISDRYATSTLAYQGYGHGLDLDSLASLIQFATGGLVPDLIIYLDLPVTCGLERKQQDRCQGVGEWTRMDEQHVAFHQRVRQGYLAMASATPDRWLVVDASQTIQPIHEIIVQRVESML